MICLAKIVLIKEMINSAKDLRSDLFQVGVPIRLLIEKLNGFRKRMSTFSPSAPLVIQLWVKISKKEFEKINLTHGWESKRIPQLLHTIYYCLITEESWHFIKRLKNPTIHYKRLMSLTYAKIKELKPELF